MRNEQRSTELHTDMLQGLMDSVLAVYLQPLYSVRERRVIGAEALTRIVSPNGRAGSPFDFIEGLEKIRITSLLDYETLRRVCGLLAEWGRRWPDLRLGCNISRLTLMEDDFVDCLDSILSDTRAEPCRLVIEIAESSGSIPAERIKRQMAALRIRGISVAIDNFGAQASCLEMLCLPQTDIVKLDRSLVIGAEKSARAETVLAGIVDLCHRLGVACVADGVEETAQQARMVAIYCDCLQGHLVGEPMPADEFFAHFAPHTEETP